MKGMDAQQVQSLIDYLNKRIDRNRYAADRYLKGGNPQMTVVAQAQAAEVECVLAYIMGLMYETSVPSG